MKLFVSSDVATTDVVKACTGVNISAIIFVNNIISCMVHKVVQETFN